MSMTLLEARQEAHIQNLKSEGYDWCSEHQGEVPENEIRMVCKEKVCLDCCAQYSDCCVADVYNFKGMKPVTAEPKEGNGGWCQGCGNHQTYFNGAWEND